MPPEQASNAWTRSAHWLGKEAFLGVRLRVGKPTHYAWVKISTPPDQPGGFIRDWAWSPQPGASAHRLRGGATTWRSFWSAPALWRFGFGARSVRTVFCA